VRSDQQAERRAEELLKDLHDMSNGKINPYYAFDTQGRNTYIFTLEDLDALRKLLSKMTLH